MKIDADKLVIIAKSLSKDISETSSESGVTIGNVNGVYFRLVALDETEAIASDVDTVREEHRCLFK